MRTAGAWSVRTPRISGGRSLSYVASDPLRGRDADARDHGHALGRRRTARPRQATRAGNAGALDEWTRDARRGKSRAPNEDVGRRRGNEGIFGGRTASAAALRAGRRPRTHALARREVRGARGVGVATSDLPTFPQRVATRRRGEVRRESTRAHGLGSRAVWRCAAA